MVFDEAMGPKRDIVSSSVNSPNHTSLVAAVKTAGLVGTLQGEGPFWVLTSVNDAFGNLPEGTAAHLLKPEAKPKFTSVLT